MSESLIGVAKDMADPPPDNGKRPSSSESLSKPLPLTSTLGSPKWSFENSPCDNTAQSRQPISEPLPYNPSHQILSEQYRVSASTSTNSWPQDNPLTLQLLLQPSFDPPTTSSPSTLNLNRLQHYNSPSMMNPSRPGATDLILYNDSSTQNDRYRSPQEHSPIVQEHKSSVPQEHLDQSMRERNATRWNYGANFDCNERSWVREEVQVHRPPSSRPTASPHEERRQRPNYTHRNFDPKQSDQTPLQPQQHRILEHPVQGLLSTISGTIHLDNEAAVGNQSIQQTSKYDRYARAHTIDPELIHRKSRSRRESEFSHYDPQHSSPAKRPSSLGSPFGSHALDEALRGNCWSKHRVFKIPNGKPLSMVRRRNSETMHAKRPRSERSHSMQPTETPVNQKSRANRIYQEGEQKLYSLQYDTRTTHFNSFTGQSSSSSGGGIDIKDVFLRSHFKNNVPVRNLHFFYDDFTNNPLAFSKQSCLTPESNLTQQKRSSPQISGMEIHSFLENGEIQHHTPPVISLLSSGDNTPQEPIKRSIPMKDRILSAKKAPTMKNSATWKTSTALRRAEPPKAKKAEAEVEKESPEIIRQKAAAKAIADLETTGNYLALQEEIFGGVQEDDEETKQKKLDAQRAEAQAAREATEAQEVRDQEAARIVEQKRQRLADEEAEQARWQKEREEAYKKVIRDAERKKAEAVNERALEEKRQLAAQKIEADRVKATAEAEERQRTRREVEDKAKSFQADKDILAELKAKQEIAKKQAASLNASKLPNPDEAAKEALDKDSLFLPEDAGPRQSSMAPGDSDDRQLGGRSRSLAPGNAAELFAKNTSKGSVSGYRAEREAMEARIAEEKALAARQKLEARWKAKAERRLADLPQRRAPIRDRLTPPETRRRGGPPANSRAKKAPSAFQIDDFDFPSETEASGSGTGSRAKPTITASQPERTISHLTASFSSVNNSFSSTKSAPAAPQPQVYSSSVKLISEVERENFERCLAAEKQSRAEAQKLARRKKDDEKANERRRQRLIDEAREAGLILSDDALEEKLSAFVAKREAERQRRAENRRRRELIENLNFAPESFVLEALRTQTSSASSPKAPSNDTDEQDETPENRDQKANQADFRKHLNALVGTRGTRFHEAAQKKTVADLQSDSEESEEDADDDFQPNGGKNILTPHGSDGESVEDEAEAQGGAKDTLNPEDHDVQIIEPKPDVSASFEKRSTNAAQNFNPHHKPDESHKPSVKDQIYVYVVLQRQTIYGEELEQEIIEKFVSRDDANSYARDRVASLRQKYEHEYPAVSESYDDDLYFAQIWSDKVKQNGILIRISRQLQAIQDLANFDPSTVQKRLYEKVWMLRRTVITKNEGDDETLVKKTKDSDIIPGFYYPNVVDANHAACTAAFKFIKPKTPNIEWVVQHENSWGPELRGARDQFTEKIIPFSVELEVDDTNLQWMRPISQIEFEVEEFKMKGPTN